MQGKPLSLPQRPCCHLQFMVANARGVSFSTSKTLMSSTVYGDECEGSLFLYLKENFRSFMSGLPHYTYFLLHCKRKVQQVTTLFILLTTWWLLHVGADQRPQHSSQFCGRKYVRFSFFAISINASRWQRCRHRLTAIVISSIRGVSMTALVIYSLW